MVIEFNPTIVTVIVFLEIRIRIRIRDEKRSYKKPPFQGAGSYKRMKLLLDQTLLAGEKRGLGAVFQVQFA